MSKLMATETVVL